MFMMTNPIIQVQIKAAADEEQKVRERTEKLLSDSTIRVGIDHSNRYSSDRKLKSQEHSQKMLIEWIRRMRKHNQSSPEDLAEIIIDCLFNGWNSIDKAKFSFRKTLTVRKVASAMCYQYSPDVNKMINAIENVPRCELKKIIAYFLRDLAIHGVHKWLCVEPKKTDNIWEGYVNIKDIHNEKGIKVPCELPIIAASTPKSKKHPGVEALAIFQPSVILQFDSTSGTLNMCVDSLKTKIESIDNHLLTLRTEMNNLSKERDGLVDMLKDLEDLNQHIRSMRNEFTYTEKEIQ